MRHVLLVLFDSIPISFFILDSSVAVCTFAFVLCNRIYCVWRILIENRRIKCVFMCECVSARFYCNVHVLKMLFNFVSWRLTMIINYFIAPGSIEKYRLLLPKQLWWSTLKILCALSLIDKMFAHVLDSLYRFTALIFGKLLYKKPTLRKR